MDNEIVFVTHNTGKIKSAERHFKNSRWKRDTLFFRKTSTEIYRIQLED